MLEVDKRYQFLINFQRPNAESGDGGSGGETQNTAVAIWCVGNKRRGQRTAPSPMATTPSGPSWSGCAEGKGQRPVQPSAVSTTGVQASTTAAESNDARGNVSPWKQPIYFFFLLSRMAAFSITGQWKLFNICWCRLYMPNLILVFQPRR